MLYTKVILGAIIVLIVIYYIMVIGQLFGGWKITDKQINFNKLIVPFYYWAV